MCSATSVHSYTPTTFGAWWRQRIRWNVGGTQAIIKYHKKIFKNSMLGYYIIPYFSMSLFIGLFGLGIFSYLLIKRFLVSYLITKYSLYANTALLTMQDLSFFPSILNFLGITLFALGSSFTLFALSKIARGEIRNKNIFNMAFYLTVYLAIYPFIMVSALSKLIMGRYSWYGK